MTKIILKCFIKHLKAVLFDKLFQTCQRIQLKTVKFANMKWLAEEFSQIDFKTVFIKNINIKKAWVALSVYFSNKLQFEQKLHSLLQARTDDQEIKMSNQNCKLAIFHFLVKLRKATNFTPLRVNCQEINQVTPKCQMNFFSKTCKMRSKTE